MNDALEQFLRVGDRVAYCPTGSRSDISVHTVTGFTKKRIALGEYVRAKPCTVVKIFQQDPQWSLRA